MKKIKIKSIWNIFTYQDQKQKFYITAFSLLKNKIILYRQNGKIEIFLNEEDEVYKNNKLIYN